MAHLTISDIAKKVGVSKSTVSRALNNSSDISEATRQKIMDVMEKDGYIPSTAARTLSKQTSDSIGVIIPEIDNPFFGNMLRGIIDVLDQSGLSMICCNTDNKAEKDLEALQMMKNQRVRGLIYTPAVDYTKNINKTALSKILKQMNLPIVQADRLSGCFNSDCVLFDDNETIYQATKLLIEKGHTKIGIINAKLDFYLARIRHQGFLRAMEECHVPVQDNYLFFGDYYFNTAYELANKMLSMPDRPTAVITCNNNSTLGLVKALSDRGEELSKDIACIGLDRIASLDMVGFNLNYIERDSYKMGKTAMELLVRRFAFPEQPEQTVRLDAPLVIKKL